MNQKPEMSSAEIERLLVGMSANNTLNIELTDMEVNALLASVPPVKGAEHLATRASLKMQEAQRKREQRLPTFALGRQLVDARLSAGLTLDQVAEQAAIPASELEELERGSWGIDQLIRQFSASIMIRILAVTRIAVQDYSEKLIELTQEASRKLTQTTVYGRSGHSSNSKSAHLIADVADYINELQRLSS